MHRQMGWGVMRGSADCDFCTCFQGPTGYKGEQGEVGKDGEKVKTLSTCG